ncbi:hypothetical protein GCM10009827_093250 [Dactylosporangium maewongense]|uniref:Leucine rich repeat variant n=1 Tax=Dactylosporangium maewongense TaxID=634393 RepID=A0ABP4NBW8_9ACTN
MGLLNGLAENPALPADLLDALIAAGDDELLDDLAWRDDLSAAQVRAIAARSTDAAVCLVHHGHLLAADVDGRDARIVAALLDATGAPPEWAHAHAASPDPWIRQLLASAAHTPAEVVAQLADDPEKDVVDEAARSPAMTATLAERLARHPHTRVRMALAANEATPGGVLAALARDGAHPPAEACPGCDGTHQPADWEACDGGHESAVRGIQSMAAGNRSTPAPALVLLARHPDSWVRWAVAARPDLPQDEYARLATDPVPEVRHAIAANPAVDVATLRSMAADPTPGVQQCLMHNPNVPLDILTGLAATTRTGPTPLSRLAAEIEATPPQALTAAGGTGPAVLPRIAGATAGELRELATSRVPAVRMLAARHPGLPGDLVDALAADPDAAVLQAVARNPRVSPARMHAMLTAHGVRVAGALAGNPACPADLLLRIATLRPPAKLALREIARHPNATGPALAACLADGKARRAAARHPALDAGTLIALLDDGVAEAAANPSLPRDVMRALIQAPVS